MRVGEDGGSTEARSCLVVSEFASGNCDPGLDLRADSLVQHYRSIGFECERVALHGGMQSATGMGERLSASLRRVSTASDVDLTVVCGLSAPHMVLYARLLCRYRGDVSLDLCDSALLLTVMRLRAMYLVSMVFAVSTMILTFVFAGRFHGISYISKRDAESDRFLLRRRVSSSIIPNVTNVTYRGASPKPDRLIVSANYEAEQNSAGLRTLARALGELESEGLHIPLELYGVGEVPAALLHFGIHKGWVTNLDDLYALEVVVFASNTGGSGVPNKLVQALASGRTVLVHESYRVSVPSDANVLFYESGPVLAAVLKDAFGLDAVSGA